MALKKIAEPTPLAMHSADSPDWGTPPIPRRFSACFLRPSALGDAIDLDYASSKYWNTWWQDKDRPVAYLDGSRGKDVLVEEDRRRAVTGHGCGAGHLNAPGANGGEMVQKCWELFENDHRIGWLHSGVWIGFSLEQLTSLQGIAPRSPLSVHDGTVITIIPCRRIRYELHPEQLIALLKKKQARRKRTDPQWAIEERQIQRLRQRADDEPVPGSHRRTRLTSRSCRARRSRPAAVSSKLRGSSSRLSRRIRSHRSSGTRSSALWRCDRDVSRLPLRGELLGA